MQRSNSEGGLTSDLAASLHDKYLFFSDNTIKDRLAAHVAMTSPPARGRAKRGCDPAAAVEKAGQLEPSGPTSSGWDKYYFFSVPVDNSTVGPTARLGRSRPAAAGPQTFCSEAFSQEVVARERKRIEGRGSLTSYTEFFSQLPRAPTSMRGLPDHEKNPPAAPSSTRPESGCLARTASDSVLGCPGAGRRLGLGPSWPPQGPTRPDPRTTRDSLFGPGGHRTFVDLYSADRPAGHSYHYNVFVT